MRKLSVLLVVFALAMLCGCKENVPTLHIYVWADYISRDVISNFEHTYNCYVSIDTYESNEAMYERLKAGKEKYDLIMPSSYYLKVLDDDGVLSNLDFTKLPNVTANLDKRLAPKAGGATFGKHVPYAVSSTGIGCDSRLLGTNEPSWSLVTNSVFKRRTTSFDDMRGILGSALKALGYSLNSVNPKEVNEARDLAITWKRSLAKFGNEEEYRTGLASGEFLLSLIYNVDILQVQEENHNIVFVYPKEGFEMTTDDFVIPVSAGNKDLAHAFIDFCYRPEQAKANMVRIGCLCPVTGAYPLLPAEIRNNPAIFPGDAILARGEYTQDLGTNSILYTEAWEKVQAAE